MSETLNAQVAERIRRELGAQRKSGSRLARELSRSQTWMSARTTGTVRMSVDDIDQIARGLDVPITRLLGFDDPESNPGSSTRRSLLELVAA